jgi:cell division protein FtsW
MSPNRLPLWRLLARRIVLESDLVLLGTMAVLCMIGVLMIYTATTPMSDRVYGESWMFLRTHLLHLTLGCGALLAGLLVPYPLWRRVMPLALLVCLLMLILVLIPGIGYQVGGARRWLRLGMMNFQPVELLKFVLVVYVASYLDRKQDLVHEFLRGVMPNLTVMGVFLSLVMLQPDFGSVVLIALTLLLMIFAGGAKPGHILGSLIAFGFLGGYLAMSQAYRAARIMAFLNPWQDRYDSGFQIVQSFLAFGSGGVFGVGLGASRQKMFFLPDAHTDFIMSILAEELGLVAVLAVLALYALFLWRAFRICLAARDDFGRCLSFGIATMLSFEVVLNLAVVMGLMPTKGLTLPFISYGGSSLLLSLFMTGVLLNVGRQGAGRQGGRSSSHAREVPGSSKSPLAHA